MLLHFFFSIPSQILNFYAIFVLVVMNNRAIKGFYIYIFFKKKTVNNIPAMRELCLILYILLLRKTVGFSHGRTRIKIPLSPLFKKKMFNRRICKIFKIIHSLFCSCLQTFYLFILSM